MKKGSKDLLGEFAALVSEQFKESKPTQKAITEKIDVESNTTDTVQKYAEMFSRNKSVNEQQDPLVPLNQDFLTRKDLEDHYKLFISRIQTQLASIGGGGEVNLRNLDDIDRSTIGENRHLAYRASDGKFFFEPVQSGEQVQSNWSETDTEAPDFILNKPTNLSDFNNDENFITLDEVPANPDGDGTTIEVSNNVISVINLPANTVIGPIKEFEFDTNHNHAANTVGTLCWNSDDETLNLNHPGGVTQQIGQETYAYVRNGTANTIPNGTVVQFSGAEQNGTARLLVAPMLADGTYPSLYGLGVATQDIDSGEDGRVTVWGKVRGIDMSAFSVGDILYASANTAGEFTKVKPTAPNNVIPVAAVLNNDSENGEIFVRPTIEQKMSYGVFTRTTNLSPTNDTPAVVGFDTSEISNGVSIVSNSQITVDQSGLYQIEWTLHWDSQGTGFGTDPVYTFLRKNGTDVANTLRRNSVSDFDSAGQTFTTTRTLSLDADDYIEVVIVTTGGNVDLVAQAAITSPFNAPATAAAEITVAQIQL